MPHRLYSLESGRIQLEEPMDKQEALELCKKLLNKGIYARPSHHPVYKDWEIVVNHTADSFGYELDGLRFQDCHFTRWEGMKTQDYPIFYKE